MAFNLKQALPPQECESSSSLLQLPNLSNQQFNQHKPSQQQQGLLRLNNYNNYRTNVNPSEQHQSFEDFDKTSVQSKFTINLGTNPFMDPIDCQSRKSIPDLPTNLKNQANSFKEMPTQGETLSQQLTPELNPIIHSAFHRMDSSNSSPSSTMITPLLKKNLQTILTLKPAHNEPGQSQLYQQPKNVIDSVSHSNYNAKLSNQGSYQLSHQAIDDDVILDENPDMESKLSNTNTFEGRKHTRKCSQEAIVGLNANSSGSHGIGPTSLNASNTDFVSTSTGTIQFLVSPKQEVLPVNIASSTCQQPSPTKREYTNIQNQIVSHKPEHGADCCQQLSPQRKFPLPLQAQLLPKQNLSQSQNFSPSRKSSLFRQQQSQSISTQYQQNNQSPLHELSKRRISSSLHCSNRTDQSHQINSNHINSSSRSPYQSFIQQNQSNHSLPWSSPSDLSPLKIIQIPMVISIAPQQYIQETIRGEEVGASATAAQSLMASSSSTKLTQPSYTAADVVESNYPINSQASIHNSVVSSPVQSIGSRGRSSYLSQSIQNPQINQQISHPQQTFSPIHKEASKIKNDLDESIKHEMNKSAFQIPQPQQFIDFRIPMKNCSTYYSNIPQQSLKVTINQSNTLFSQQQEVSSLQSRTQFKEYFQKQNQQIQQQKLQFQGQKHDQQTSIQKQDIDQKFSKEIQLDSSQMKNANPENSLSHKIPIIFPAKEHLTFRQSVSHPYTLTEQKETLTTGYPSQTQSQNKYNLQRQQELLQRVSSQDIEIEQQFQTPTSPLLYTSQQSPLLAHRLPQQNIQYYDQPKGQKQVSQILKSPFPSLTQNYNRLISSSPPQSVSPSRQQHNVSPSEPNRYIIQQEQNQNKPRLNNYQPATFIVAQCLSLSHNKQQKIDINQQSQTVSNIKSINPAQILTKKSDSQLFEQNVECFLDGFQPQIYLK